MTDSASPSIVTAYGIWLAKTSRDWPKDAWHIARRALIDTVACMIPGAADSAPAKLWPVVRSWGSGSSRAVVRNEALSAPAAALFNGTAAHALDFDDNFDPAKAHASAALIPALLAVGDAQDSSIGDILDGYIAGLQIMGLIGQAVNPFHRSRGWHATGTLGAIGAAAGCARLLALNDAEAGNAISISTSLAGGFMSQFGSDTKPLHAGLAASGGVQAALFARASLTAGHATLEGQTGLQTLMVGPDLEDLSHSMEGKAEHGQTMRFDHEVAKAPLHIVEHGLKVKRFPNCGSLHRALDGLIALMERHHFAPSDVEYVLTRAPTAHLKNLMHENPQTPAEAKFSLEYSMAAALISGTVGLDDYRANALFRPNLRAEMPKIRKEHVDALESEFPTEVHAKMWSGEKHSIALKMPVGSKAVPMSDAQLWQKLETCLAAAQEFDGQSKLLSQLSTLDHDKPIRHLTEALQNRKSD